MPAPIANLPVLPFNFSVSSPLATPATPARPARMEGDRFVASTPSATPTRGANPSPAADAVRALGGEPAADTASMVDRIKDFMLCMVAPDYDVATTPQAFRDFATEMKAIADADLLGRGSDDAQAITELQQVLNRFGYPVKVTGEFGDDTADALTKFKLDNGLYAHYATADGKRVALPFVDDATKAVIVKRLTAGS